MPIRSSGRRGSEARNLRGPPFGEKDVPQRRRLRRAAELLEDRAFEREPGFETEPGAARHDIDGPDRRALAGKRPGHRRTSRRDGDGLRPWQGSIRQAAERAREPLAEEREGKGQPIPAGDRVHDAEPQRFRRGHAAARGDQVERRRDADETREALRTARARDDAEGDFRQPDGAQRIESGGSGSRGRVRAPHRAPCRAEPRPPASRAHRLPR